MRSHGICGGAFANEAKGDLTEVLSRIAAWIDTEPEAPDGEWWKDFGEFKLVGTGKYPKSLLDSDMTARGDELD